MDKDAKFYDPFDTPGYTSRQEQPERLISVDRAVLVKLCEQLDQYMADPDDIGVISNVYGELYALLEIDEKSS